MGQFMRPAVHVYQELLTSTPSLKTPFTMLCVVGPVYQVERGVVLSTFAPGVLDKDYGVPFPRRQTNTIIYEQRSNLYQMSLNTVRGLLWPTNGKLSEKCPVREDSGLIILTIPDQNADFSDLNVTSDMVAIQLLDKNNKPYVLESGIKAVNPAKKEFTLLKYIDISKLSEVSAAVIRPIAGNYPIEYSGTHVSQKSVLLIQFSGKRAPAALVHDVPNNKYLFNSTDGAFLRTGAKAGDFIDVWDNQNPGDFTKPLASFMLLSDATSDSQAVLDGTVYARQPDGSYTATKTAFFEGASYFYRMMRPISVPAQQGWYVVGDTAGGEALFSITQEIHVVVGSNKRDYRVYSGSPTITYAALRIAQANQPTKVAGFIDAMKQFGNIVMQGATPTYVPDALNPMAVAIQVVNANTPGMPFYIVAINDDSPSGYFAALDRLTNVSDVYTLNALTQDQIVVSAFNNHCKLMSTPEKSKWRITYQNLRQPKSYSFIAMDKTHIGTITHSETKDHWGTVIDRDHGTFITAGTRVGDMIDIFDLSRQDPIDLNDPDFAVKVSTVESDTQVGIGADCYRKNADGSYTIVVMPVREGDFWYAVNHLVEKPQDLTEALSAIAISYKSKRLRLVQPDLVTMDLYAGPSSTSNGLIELQQPGMYMCTAYAAMRAGFPPHQGFTTLGVSGFKSLIHSNNLFSDDQLDYMAGNGIFWVVQYQPGELPYCIYQTTTDNTQLETAEDSFIATVDYASKYYKDNLGGVIGKFNVNEISMTYVRNVVNSISDTLTRVKFDYIGPILLKATLDEVIAVGATIQVRNTIEVPFPVNEVNLFLEVATNSATK